MAKVEFMVRLHDMSLDAFSNEFEFELKTDMARAWGVATQDIQIEALAGSMVLVVKIVNVMDDPEIGKTLVQGVHDFFESNGGRLGGHDFYQAPLVVPPAPFSASRPFSRAAADAAADLSAISDMGYHKGVWKTRYTAQRAMR